ncbi:AcrR family transcriptional regulator [Nocardia kruczakiae]|uniref:AcrR family transcriptional regulator n=1 Tax=Nocardia kruczakiae TaxID=261477 RepID=A0ABU1X9Z3_9NOCA|nr:TetR/AcrR family transcriptional regulator [Nocardia kruczakiae]MDR7167354.1 AcrR family transcriptional regulator [Nocardia kruczakiae]
MMVQEPSSRGRLPVSARGKHTREALLVAARAAFEEHGVADVNVTAITRRAGVGYGSFYGHFTSSDDVFQTLAHEFMRSVHIESRAPAEVDDPLSRFTDENRRFFQLYHENARMFQLIEERAAVDPGFRKLYLETRRSYVSRMARNLTRLVSEGAIDSGLDIESTAEILSGMVERAAQLSVLEPGRDEERLLTALEGVWRRAVGYRGD